ncbi:MAG: hypothetical protein EOO60_07145, partial [Hymenobacter sp.]
MRRRKFTVLYLYSQASSLFLIMKCPTLWLLCGLLFTTSAYAQTPPVRFGFEVGSVAKLVQGTDTLAHAWA